MVKVFEKVRKKFEDKECKSNKNEKMVKRCRAESSNANSNLTQDEIKGINSLKKRVQNGELVVTETDKSK